MGAIGNDDFRNGMAEIVGLVARDAIGFGLVEPDDDDAMILVGVGSHNHRNDLAEEIVALQDFSGIAGQTFVARAERGVHVVVLVGRDPVVVGNGTVSE